MRRSSSFWPVAVAVAVALSLSPLFLSGLGSLSGPVAEGADIVFTIAGGGSLDGYDAREANVELGSSQGLAIDAAGNLFLSDSEHQQVLKVDRATGKLRVLAGNGTQAYFGDGLPATTAGLNRPGALALDPAGNLYIVDRGNLVIRRVEAASGIISTVAGNGNRTGDPKPGGGNWAIGDGGPATDATFSDTMGGIAIDGSGNVIIADSGNQCVRRFPVGGTITRIAGVAGSNGFSGDGVVGGATAALLSDPTGIAVAPSGDIYIADSVNRRVRRLNLAATIQTIAGTGGGGSTGFSGDGLPATNANLGSLGGLAFDPAGDLLISCVRSACIRKVNVLAPSPIIVTIAGRGGATLGDLGPATSATLGSPRDVAVDAAGNIFVYQTGDDRVRRIDALTGFIDTVVGTGLSGFIGDRGLQEQGVLLAPTGATYDASGNLYIADTLDHAIRRVAPDGTITTIAGNGQPGYAGDGGPSELAILDSPRDVAMLGNLLLIADSQNDLVRAIDLTTGIITTYAQVPAPMALVVDSGNVVYVSRNNQIDRIDTNRFVSLYVDNLNGPDGMALTSGGDLYVANTGDNQVIRVSPGAPPTVAVVAGTGNAGFGGDDGQATAADLDSPSGVALTGADLVLVITDTGNERVRSVDLSTGIITTIVGNGTPGFSGDGGPASSAQVNEPRLIVPGGGGLIFADTSSNRIRKIITPIDLDPANVVLQAKLSFAVDSKTGETATGKDSVSVKAKLPLPDGIAAANLILSVNIVDLSQQVQLDSKGKQPKGAKAAKVPPPGPFDFTLPAPPPGPSSKFQLGLKGTSVAGATPVSFSFSSKGTFRDLLGRAGLTDVTTPKEGVSLPVRVNITLGDTTFSGVTNVLYKATQNKSGSAKSLKP